MGNRIIDHLKSFFDKEHTIIRTIAAFILSIILIVWPGIIGKTFLIILGAVFLAIAIYDAVRIAALEKRRLIHAKEAAGAESGLNTDIDWKKVLKRIPISSMLYLIAGIILVSIPGFILTVLMTLFAIMFLIYAVIQLIAGISVIRTLKSQSTAVMWTAFIVPTIIIILSIVILCNPFGTVKGLLVFTGITMLVFSVFELIRILLFKTDSNDLTVIGE